MTTIHDPPFIFMDLNGSPLSFNPQEKLADYRAKHPLTNTGIVELCGKRAAQEDRVVMNECAIFLKLIEKNRKQALINTIKKLQEIVTENNLNAGSTLCMTVLCKNKIYTANVGDGTAYLAVVDSEGHITQFFRLNRVLHHPTEKTEAKRFKVGTVHRCRLGGMLMLSRAIGDNAFERYGLLHEPEKIYVDKIVIPENGKAFIINACDGMTEGDCLTEKDIIAIIEKNHDQASDIIALKLARAASENGSHDNISVLVSPVDQTTKYLAVFDGHGGDEISELLFKEFDRVWNQEIQKYEK